MKTSEEKEGEQVVRDTSILATDNVIKPIAMRRT